MFCKLLTEHRQKRRCDHMQKSCLLFTTQHHNKASVACTSWCWYVSSAQSICQKPGTNLSTTQSAVLVQLARPWHADLAATWAVNRRNKMQQQVLADWSNHAKRQTLKRQQICEVIEVNRRRLIVHTVFSAWRARAQVQSVILPVSLTPCAIAQACAGSMYITHRDLSLSKQLSPSINKWKRCQKHSL